MLVGMRVRRTDGVEEDSSRESGSENLQEEDERMREEAKTEVISPTSFKRRKEARRRTRHQKGDSPSVAANPKPYPSSLRVKRTRAGTETSKLAHPSSSSPTQPNLSFHHHAIQRGLKIISEST